MLQLREYRGNEKKEVAEFQEVIPLEEIRSAHTISPSLLWIFRANKIERIQKAWVEKMKCTVLTVVYSIALLGKKILTLLRKQLQQKILVLIKGKGEKQNLLPVVFPRLDVTSHSF